MIIRFSVLICLSVDGGWGAWGSWTPCSKTCGGAMVTRERKCENPASQNGGKPCDSKDSKETKNDCNQPCESKFVNITRIKISLSRVEQGGNKTKI